MQAFAWTTLIIRTINIYTQKISYLQVVRVNIFSTVLMDFLILPYEYLGRYICGFTATENTLIVFGILTQSVSMS